MPAASGGGQVHVEYTYDLLNRRTGHFQHKTSGNLSVTYDYDEAGNLVYIQDAKGQEFINVYYDLNRVREQQFPAGGDINRIVTTYDPNNNVDVVTEYKTSGTEITDHTYDLLDRLTGVDQRGHVVTYAYDDNGNRIQQIELQNGFASNQQQTTVYGFDQLDRMESYAITDQATGVVTTTTYSFHNSYDRATEVVTEDNGTTVSTIKDRSFSYDETYWLTTITDNLTSQTIDYSYDDNGNTLTKLDNTETPAQSTLFTYNTRNQLINVQAGDQGAESGKGSYDYNYQGMRIRHLGSERGNVEYIYDGGAVLQEVANASTSLIAHYRYADRLLSLTTPSAVQFYHYAALGTTANLSDSSGTVAKSYRVDPYGEITHQEGNSVNRQVFTGQEHDEQTGLIYFGARYYDPDIARFITQDTYLGEPGTAPSLHRYLYAYGNPTVYIDPNGNIAVLEGTADGLGDLREHVMNTAADSNMLGAAVMGLGAGLVGVLEFGAHALNLAGDLAVDAIADENSDSFFVQDSRRSLSESKETLTKVADVVVNNPGQVASTIAQGVTDTAVGIANGDSRSIAQGAAFGFEALSGGGLTKATASATKQATKTLAIQTQKVAATTSNTITREATNLLRGGSRAAEALQSAGRAIKESAQTIQSQMVTVAKAAVGKNPTRTAFARQGMGEADDFYNGVQSSAKGVIEKTAPNEVLKRGTGGQGYRVNDSGPHGELSPGLNRAQGNTIAASDGRVQSHHPIQQKWAKQNVPGYNPNEAPAILLKTGKGDPHALINGMQRKSANGAGNTLR